MNSVLSSDSNSRLSSEADTTRKDQFKLENFKEDTPLAKGFLNLVSFPYLRKLYYFT